MRKLITARPRKNKLNALLAARKCSQRPFDTQTRPSHNINVINILYKHNAKRRGIKRYSKGRCNSKLTCDEFVALVIVLRFLLVKKMVSIKTAQGLYRDNGFSNSLCSFPRYGGRISLMLRAFSAPPVFLFFLCQF